MQAYGQGADPAAAVALLLGPMHAAERAAGLAAISGSSEAAAAVAQHYLSTAQHAVTVSLMCRVAAVWVP